MIYTFGSQVDASAFVEDGSTPASQDVDSPPPLRPKPGTPLAVRDYATKADLPDIATGDYGWWQTTTVNIPVIEVSADGGTTWTPQIAVEVRTGAALQPRLWYPMSSITDAVRDGDIATDGTILFLRRAGEWVAVANPAVLDRLDFISGQGVDLQQQIDSLKQLIKSGGSLSNDTLPSEGWATIANLPLTSATAWHLEGRGATVGGGALTLSGMYMGGKATTNVTGVAPGHQIRFTFTVDATKTTGGALPSITFVDNRGPAPLYPDAVGMTPPTSRAITQTTTYTCTVPAGATDVLVGAAVGTGTVVITGIQVEQA